MSFTRFHYDVERTKKNLQQATGPSRYILNTPGPGNNVGFMKDPFVRLQKWGGNLRKTENGPIDINSYLIGLKDNIKSTPYKFIHDNTTITNQSRVTNPSWLYKDLEQNHRYILLEDPQKFIQINFETNVNTRLKERDNFVPTLPNIK
tara:strand:+ start:243 stop:686 length:444 start_codon:yes stop_codon:yes gene_type:complete